MIILYEIAYGVYDAMRIFMTRQAQTHTHTRVCSWIPKELEESDVRIRRETYNRAMHHDV